VWAFGDGAAESAAFITCRSQIDSVSSCCRANSCARRFVSGDTRVFKNCAAATGHNVAP
jgi:hypothetical protein